MRMKWIATSRTAAWCEKVPQPTEASAQLSVTDRRQQAIEGFLVLASTNRELALQTPDWVLALRPG